MTYCLAIKIDDGLICLADGRLTAGNEVTQARKVSLHATGPASICIMTSGLRSLRDKTLAYFDRTLAGLGPKGCDSMLDALEVYGRCLRQVEQEDRESLEGSQLTFNLHSLVAGQLPEDAEPRLFMIYPEANWVEIGRRSPYFSIGATAYGKPILDRVLRSDSPFSVALKLAYLSFDSSRFSSADVGFPLDILTYAVADRTWREAHYEYDDINDQRIWWNENITRLAMEMPDGPWVSQLIPGGRLSLVKDS